MKFAGLAAALEELKSFLDSACIIEEKIVLSKDDYDKLKKLGGGDDNECILKAIMAYISKADFEVQPEIDVETAPSVRENEITNTTIIKCAKCRASIEVPTSNMPSEIKCSQCGATGQLKVKA
jgi:hypothetical protein